MRSAWLGPILGAWIAAVAVGGLSLWRYAAAPGAPGAPPATWPADAALHRTPGLATIVMLAHPHCPCTRASVAELAELLRSVDGRAEAHVLFTRPDDEGDDWAHTDLYRAAEDVPGAHVHVDPGGREAHRFGAETSGQTAVYDPSGKLVFAGGITGVRGHEGDNAGLRRARDVLTEGRADRDTSLVFGCPLQDPQ